jgi:hypothetical protein
MVWCLVKHRRNFTFTSSGKKLLLLAITGNYKTVSRVNKYIYPYFYPIFCIKYHHHLITAPFCGLCYIPGLKHFRTVEYDDHHHHHHHHHNSGM